MACFYCRNPINRLVQPRVHACIKRHCQGGGEDRRERDFHISCFDKFLEFGRPRNPDTEYSVVWATEMIGGEEIREVAI